MIKIFINLLTSVRIIFAFIIFLLVSLESNYSIAFLLFFLAGITDYFDGFLARKYRASSDIGEILDYTFNSCRRQFNKDRSLEVLNEVLPKLESLFTKLE